MDATSAVTLRVVIFQYSNPGTGAGIMAQIAIADVGLVDDLMRLYFGDVMMLAIGT